LVTGFGDDWRSYFVYFDDPLHICYDATVKQLSESIRKQYPNTLVVEVPFAEENENEDQPNWKTDRIFDICENLSYGRFDVRMIGSVVNPDWGSIVFCITRITVLKIEFIVIVLQKMARRSTLIHPAMRFGWSVWIG